MKIISKQKHNSILKGKKNYKIVKTKLNLWFEQKLARLFLN